MAKVIKQVKVNDQQLDILVQYKDKLFRQKTEVHETLFPPLADALRQIRELTQNIAVISGAIAAFTIPVVNTNFIQIKFLAYLSLVLLFATICYAIYHLSEVIPKEVNELSRQHSTYMKVLDDEIERINGIIESGNINEFVLKDQEIKKTIDQLDQLKTPPSPDRSLDNLRLLILIALTSLTLSFIPLNIYTESLEFFVELYNKLGLLFSEVILFTPAPLSPY